MSLDKLSTKAASVSRRQFGTGAAALGALLLTGGHARAADSVRLAISPTSLTYLPIYWALDKGFFAEEGVTPEILSFSGSSAATAALLGGSVDIITGGTVALVKVAGKGQDMVGIAGVQAIPTVAVVLRKDLADALGRAPTVQDLKGLRIGTPPKGGFADMCMQYILTDAGFDPAADVSLVQFNDFAAILKAGEVGQLDAALLIEPFQHVAVDLTKNWIYILHVTKGEGPALLQRISYASLMTTRAYLGQHRTVAEKVVRALVRGIAVCNDPANMEEMMAVAKHYLPDLDPLVMKLSVETQAGTFLAQITPEHLAKTIELLEVTGNLGGSAPTYEQAVDASFQPLWS